VKRRFAAILLCTTLTALLTACGGGGGSSGGDTPTTPTTPPTTPVDPPPQQSRPTGLLWHNDFSLDLRNGVQLSPLNGDPPTQITNQTDSDVAVWPDGKQYIVTRRDIARGVTDITVFDRASGNTVYQGQAAGYLRNVEPSPTDKRLVKVRQGQDSASAFEEHVLDLSTMQSRLAISDTDWFAWLPDGRYMLIGLNSGSMRVASLDGAGETIVGHLDVPADRRMGQFGVSPDGKRFLMPLTRRGSATNETDLWIGNVDGTGFEQFTDNKVFGGAAWSPDSRYVAYVTDTGISCGAGTCQGVCQQWYSSVDQRMVKGIAGTPGSEVFTVRNRSGGTTRLGCSVLAWTP
jgi:hypothetical protein